MVLGTIAIFLIGIVVLLVIISVLILLVKVLEPIFVGLIVMVIIIGAGLWKYTKIKQR